MGNASLGLGESRYGPSVWNRWNYWMGGWRGEGNCRDGVVRLDKGRGYGWKRKLRGGDARYSTYVDSARMCGYCVWMYVHVHFVRIYRVKILRVAE